MYNTKMFVCIYVSFLFSFPIILSHCIFACVIFDFLLGERSFFVDE